MFGFFNELKFLLRNKVTDPVCKMKVDKSKAKYFSEYKGENYSDPKDRKLVYFCSENCKSQFDASPKDYVEENATSSCCQNQTKAPVNKSCC